jgi:hypothetical protein
VGSVGDPEEAVDDPLVSDGDPDEIGHLEGRSVLSARGCAVVDRGQGSQLGRGQPH